MAHSSFPARHRGESPDTAAAEGARAVAAGALVEHMNARRRKRAVRDEQQRPVGLHGEARDVVARALEHRSRGVFVPVTR